MIALSVDSRGGQYQLDIGPGLLQSIEGTLAGHMAENICVVTDENVWRHHGDKLKQAFTKKELKPLILPPGEQNKSLLGLEKLYNAFAEQGLNRHGAAIAFGGGVIGDLCGFAAATYMRGVPLIQIPTTLLAQVDSSVGGKTAINLQAGKNLAGAFYQPKHVIIDTDLLASLPRREVCCGMAEVIKYGAIRSAELFGRLLSRDIPLEDTIATCCKIKAEIVSRDEFDTGERMILNFGHTFGHAIEALGGFSRYNHGEAVAIGMVIAACAGEALHVTREGTYEKLRDILTLYGLGTACGYSASEILPYISVDKKRNTDGVTLVLLRDIGEAVLRKISLTDLKAVMERTETIWRTK